MMRRLVAIEQRRIGRMAAVYRRTRRPSARGNASPVSRALHCDMHCPLPWHWCRQVLTLTELDGRPLSTRGPRLLQSVGHAKKTATCSPVAAAPSSQSMAEAVVSGKLC